MSKNRTHKEGPETVFHSLVAQTLVLLSPFTLIQESTEALKLKIIGLCL